MAVVSRFAFHNVAKLYGTGLLRLGRRQALTDVNIHGRPGEILALLGPNRSGKTTLVRLLLGLAQPSRGSVYRLGFPADNRFTLAHTGAMLERPAFPPYLTPSEILCYSGALGGMTPATVSRRATSLLDRVGLADRVHEPVSNFSKGMIQRLALARALLNEPLLLVLDEPFEGLDPEGHRLVVEAVREVRRRDGCTLLITHDEDLARTLCDRHLRLQNGRIPDEPLRNPRENTLPELIAP